MIVTTLVTGSNAQARENVIAAQLVPQVNAVVLFEGLPTGRGPLHSLNDSDRVHISYLAPSCLCCTGNLTLKVMLNRYIRQRPERLFIGLALTEHIAAIRAFLAAPPYDTLLCLTEDLHAD